MPSATDRASCKVYFVDDDRGVIHSSVQWLTLSGVNVKAFADPKLLLKAIKANDPCIVVSDIRMPDLDGMSLMKHIHTRDKNMPVILITGHGDIPLAVEAMKLGAFEFITKPFAPEGLLESIHKAQDERMRFLAQEAEEPEAKTPENQLQELQTNDLVASVKGDGQEAVPLNSLVDDYEKSIIIAALKKYTGNISPILEELDLPRRTLNAKMKKYGLNKNDFK